MQAWARNLKNQPSHWYRDVHHTELDPYISNELLRAMNVCAESLNLSAGPAIRLFEKADSSTQGAWPYPGDVRGLSSDEKNLILVRVGSLCFMVVVMAHEVRHRWQQVNGRVLNTELLAHEKLNAELDADTFAVAFSKQWWSREETEPPEISERAAIAAAMKRELGKASTKATQRTELSPTQVRATKDSIQWLKKNALTITPGVS